MPKTILIIDDDALLRRSLTFNLEQAGYQVHTAATAEDALGFIQRLSFDLVLLDIGLPGMDGLDTLRTLKIQTGIPVIFLTARRRELDQVVGLEMGADDYITKPFDIDVLLARIKAVLRRTSTIPSTFSQLDPIIVGDLVIDIGAHTVHCADREIELTRREFDILHVLASKPEKVVSTQDLLARVWGAEFEGQPQVVYVQIRWLREKLELDPEHPQRIITVRGVGYKLIPLSAV
jgi:DNA-binding response OmpR family regulator